MCRVFIFKDTGVQPHLSVGLISVRQKGGLPGPPRKCHGLGLRSGFEPSGLDRPGRLPHQQGLCEARLGYRDGSLQLGAPGPESSEWTRVK